MLQIIGVTFLAVCCSLIIKKDRPEIHFFIIIFTCIYISARLLSFAQDYIVEIKEFTSYFESDIPYVLALVKIIGITYICEVVTNICKDFGYGTLGNQVEFFAKALILASGLPIMKALFETITLIIQS